ncbi:zinc ribbon domain-containing protein [Acidianus manzaensis]|uniref:Zinc-ribbon domain-containing protein n=1 Tax=Acidianus manzaensis TaxID=282676 RepID=A0A1W6K321_9CREN|nr:zinc ribbon domain-containing protein [Acidianus manzaensis]ARM76885.1 hypothetical protein B6F84_13215 [Acidianus manzaensis]
MVKYCPRCGTQNPDDAVFCYNCGYKFPPMQPIQPGEASPYSQPPTQPNQPPPYYPSKPSKIPLKKIITGVVGAVIAVIVILAVVLVVLPHPALAYSASQAKSTFGGTWQILNNESGTITYSNGIFTISYNNGTTMKHNVSKYISGPLPNEKYFEEFEELAGKINGTKVYLYITKCIYSNSSIPKSIYASDYQGSSIHGDINGYNYTYIQYTFFGYPFESEIIAYSGNTLIIIKTSNFGPDESQMVSVLSAIT